jgi:hypothetical protein
MINKIMPVHMMICQDFSSRNTRDVVRRESNLPPRTSGAIDRFGPSPSQPDRDH